MKWTMFILGLAIILSSITLIIDFYSKKEVMDDSDRHGTFYHCILEGSITRRLTPYYSFIAAIDYRITGSSTLVVHEDETDSPNRGTK